ncbi:MAG: fluoride efflux transporter CrcB [Cyclobacteriaceae bacterium]|jgi:CrcB protein|nr:fluoride efflux transporter CrcB [Cyclobacteriaceae bacterium]
MRLLFIIGAGGFIGTVARYLFQQGISKLLPVLFPFGTLLVNLTGCFLIGVIYALSERWNILTPEWRLFLTTGICGGFTTFSTFSYETYNLIREEQYVYVSLYIGISVLVGLALTFLGILLIRSL